MSLSRAGVPARRSGRAADVRPLGAQVKLLSLARGCTSEVRDAVPTQLAGDHRAGALNLVFVGEGPIGDV
jgi:hypothetical protein